MDKNDRRNVRLTCDRKLDEIINSLKENGANRPAIYQAIASMGEVYELLLHYFDRHTAYREAVKEIYGTQKIKELDKRSEEILKKMKRDEIKRISDEINGRSPDSNVIPFPQ